MLLKKNLCLSFLVEIRAIKRQKRTGQLNKCMINCIAHTHTHTQCSLKFKIIKMKAWIKWFNTERIEKTELILCIKVGRHQRLYPQISFEWELCCKTTGQLGMKVSLTFRTKARQKKTKKSGDLAESQRVGREREQRSEEIYGSWQETGQWGKRRKKICLRREVESWQWCCSGAAYMIKLQGKYNYIFFFV